MSSPDTYRPFAFDPIRAWFVPRVTPQGPAEPAIREAFVDVPFPVRYALNEQPSVETARQSDRLGDVVTVAAGVRVDTYDVIIALRVFERLAAARYVAYNGFGGTFDEVLFDLSEGQLLPPSLAGMLLPNLETFDCIDPSTLPFAPAADC